MEDRSFAPDAARPARSTRYEDDSSASLLDQYFAELRRLPLLAPERIVALAEQMRAEERRFRDALCAVPGTAVLVLERWEERRAEGRVTGLLAHESRADTSVDWSAFIDERLGAVTKLVGRRAALPAGARRERSALDEEIAKTLASAGLLFELLQDVALSLRSLCGMPRTRAVRARRAALGLGDRRALRALERAEQALARWNEARRTLSAHNTRLVVRVAKSYAGQGVALADLIQEGNVGLLRAVEKFDPTLGYRFSTYAVWWIEQAMIRAIQRDSRTVRVPSHVYEARLRHRTAWQVLHARMPRPGLDDLAAELREPADKLAQTESAFLATESLDTPRDDDSDALPLADRLAAADPFEAGWGLDRRQIGQVLREALDRLPPRERQVIEWRFGLGDGEELTLQEIGSRLGLSRERVRQIQLTALEALAAQRDVAFLREAAA